MFFIFELSRVDVDDSPSLFSFRATPPAKQFVIYATISLKIAKNHVPWLGIR